MKVPHTTKITTHSEIDTLKFGSELSYLLERGDVICIQGEIGAGKTHLIKGIAGGLGVDQTKVNSPTFTLVNEYDGKYKLFHFDLFRIINDQELLEIGIDEYLYGDGICLIEWSEKMETFMPENAVQITITKLGNNSRQLEIKGNFS
jgi:tRNA threonylcarbamoyladenosine biosynthesis protein TsaE